MKLRAPKLKKSPAGQQANVIVSQQAPVWGWDARNPLAAMRPDAAVELVNMIPQTSSVVTRKGYAAATSGITAGQELQSLFSYSSPSASAILAFSTTKLWKISAISSAATDAGLTLTNGKWYGTNITTAAGSYFIAGNGADKPVLYNGSTFTQIDGASTPAITGLTTTTIQSFHLHKHRLWMLQASSMSAWYLPVDSIGGAASEFPLGTLFHRGGYLLTAVTWTVDAGDGADDLLVFITSEGEAAVYKGTDPTTAADWALVGVYFIGKPLGRRCAVKFSGDVLILTATGAYPFSKLLQSATINRDSALSDRISQAFTDAATLYGSYYGWQPVPFPRENLLLVNLPIVDGTQFSQYVMHTISNGWCELSGMQATCWTAHGDNLLFASGNQVYNAFVGYTDDSALIQFSAKTSFNYFGNRSKKKKIAMLRPQFRYAGAANMSFGVDEDFNARNYSTNVIFTLASSASTLWGTALWGTSLWGSSGDYPSQNWLTAACYPGFSHSLTMTGNCSGSQLTWIATDFNLSHGTAL